jgi:hypothetical protein
MSSADTSAVVLDSMAPALGERVIPLTVRDTRVGFVLREMIAGRWNGHASWHTFARDWGCTPNVVRQVADAAGQFLRLQNAHGNVVQLALVELRIIAEQQREEAPAIAIAAWRTILEQIERLAARTDSTSGTWKSDTERIDYLRACLRAPDAELIEALMAERETVLRILEAR